MKVLVTVADYPNDEGKIILMYIHTRNLYYSSYGIDVTVLNFNSKKDYKVDGINVISLNSFKKIDKNFDLLIIHAANIRNHYIFLKKYGNEFSKFLFFYHGHEVLRCNKVYSKPYDYLKKNIINIWFQDIYDSFKLFIWRKYLPKIKYKSYFVFVSRWMKDEFLKWTQIDSNLIDDCSEITYNSIGSEFENLIFKPEMKKKYDFVTIRGNLDGSKYSIDIVNRLARNTPNKKFLVVGKGDFFKYNKKSPNLEWLDCNLTHEEIINILQLSKFALMPTRTDAQGLMMCEMAAFGIPLITSNIPVCYELFEDFENVYYIDNDDIDLSLENLNDNMVFSRKHDRYYSENTVLREVKLIERLLNKNENTNL